MTRVDFTGDGRSDLIVTSPWGLGVISWNGQGLTASAMTQNGQDVGQWALDTAVNGTPVCGDLDGDGRHELLLTGPGGIGIAGFAGGSPSTRMTVTNGTRVGGWVLDTTANAFHHAADLDGDGKAELLVTSPWGIGVLGMAAASLTAKTLAPNGSRLGEWLLGTGDNWFPVVGDLNGDGRAEIVVTSAWGLGVLRLDGAALTSIAMVPNGTRIGSWTLDTATDRIEAAADLDGDGRAELVVSGPGGLAVLALDGTSLAVRAVVASGAAAGSWRVDPARDSVALVGDVDGDGRAELVVASDSGIGVLALTGKGLESRLVAANNTHFGGWNLSTWDNRLALCADIDGDGKDEVVVTSPWGVGVLRLDGTTGSTLTAAANGTHLGNWNLNTADNDLTAGHSRRWGVILHHPDWKDAVAETTQVLRDRGYVVLDTDSAPTGTEILSRLARAARPRDRVFVYLAGHGATNRANGDYSLATATSHYIEFGTGDTLSLTDIVPSFTLMAEKGCELSVFDGSCDAGETVLAADGQRYVAMASTAARAPGYTGTPSPGAAMKTFGQPSHFGLWWSSADAASVLTGQGPHRFYQKVYRNDDTDIARWSVFYKTAVDFLRDVAGAWDLVTRTCYLFEFVYADQYNDPNPSDDVVNYKAAKAKVSCDDYLASMQADHDGFEPSITKLRGFLGDHDLVARAAQVYAAAYPRPWLTTTGDPGWNVAFTPVRTYDGDADLEPITWAGAQGFTALVQECINELDALEQAWVTQTTRLRQLDAKVRTGWVFRQLVDVGVLRKALTPGEELRRAQFDQVQEDERRQLVVSLRSGGAPTLPRLSHPVGPVGPVPVHAVPVHSVPVESTPLHPGPVESTPLHSGPVQRAATVDVAAAERPTEQAAAVLTTPGSHLSVHPTGPRVPAPPAGPPAPPPATRVSVSITDPGVARWLRDVVGTWTTDESVADLVADLRATEVTVGVTLDHLHYYLTIVEEAMSRAQEARTQAGDLVTY